MYVFESRFIEESVKARIGLPTSQSILIYDGDRRRTAPFRYLEHPSPAASSSAPRTILSLVSKRGVFSDNRVHSIGNVTVVLYFYRRSKRAGPRSRANKTFSLPPSVLESSSRPPARAKSCGQTAREMSFCKARRPALLRSR